MGGTFDRRQISNSKHQHTILTNPVKDICKTINIQPFLSVFIQLC